MKTDRLYLRAQIVRWVSDDQPGVIECRFRDRFGKEWSIITKLPIVSDADIWRDSEFPQPAFVACEVVSRSLDNAGVEFAEITTSVPWGIEATDGSANFQVFEHQLTESS
jgi:hypothetical protein